MAAIRAKGYWRQIEGTARKPAHPGEKFHSISEVEWKSKIEAHEEKYDASIYLSRLLSIIIKSCNVNNQSSIRMVESPI